MESIRELTQAVIDKARPIDNANWSASKPMKRIKKKKQFWELSCLHRGYVV